MLIKSFEGFRPRAIQRAGGGWIIGYGHTLSAREGATVSEADAELLLRYDLLPVEKAVNDTVPADLNQHQFDALVSFAFSVGVDRFAGSDVRQRLNAGAPGEAADAMMGWPEPALPETALRRRAAERALFVANPDAPVALSDLLSAPVPPPAVAALAKPEPVTESPVEPEVDAPHDAEPVETVATVDSRGAAVAALLGETADRLVQTDTPDEPAADNVIVPFWRSVDAPATETATPEPAGQDAPVEASTELETDTTPEVDPTPEPSTTPDTDAERVAEMLPVTNTDTTPTTDIAAWTAARYAPYSSVMVGPLPYLQPADPIEAAVPTPDEPAIVPPVADEVEAASEEALPTETSVEAPVEPQVEAEPVPEEPVEPASGGWTSVAPVPATELILTPLEDTPELAISRPLWTPEQRDEPDGSENNLFGEDLTLTLGGGSVMRHEIEMEAPARFDWKETGPFIFMGGVGLVSFGASMAAFRRAAEQSGGSELTIIGWVLALIGLACVGVSAINLYRKFGLPGGD